MLQQQRRPEPASAILLETDRLVLRAPTPADAPVLAQLANERRIAENTRRLPYPYRRADAEAFLRQCAEGSDLVFAITAHGDGTPIGLCGLDLCGGEPELGYWLGAEYWGHGHATEAARAVVDFAFERLGKNAIVSAARVSNPASRRVLEKCGFRWTGVGLYQFRAIGASAPVDRFRLNRDEWTAASRWRRTRIHG